MLAWTSSSFGFSSNSVKNSGLLPEKRCQHFMSTRSFISQAVEHDKGPLDLERQQEGANLSDRFNDQRSRRVQSYFSSALEWPQFLLGLRCNNVD